MDCPVSKLQAEVALAGNEAPPFWYEKPGWQARCLAPAAWIYGAVARWRMDNAKSASIDAPVLCVGNLTVGGTGKTPTALALADAARKDGYSPGFVTRGYGGSHIRPHRVDLEQDTAKSVGDEPLLLAREAPTIVAQQRASGAQKLVDDGCDFIILDDGFQSRPVDFDFALITIDARRGIGNGRVLPAGPMRAPLVDQMRHCDAVLRIGEGTRGDEVVRAASRAAKPVMHAWLKPANVRAISGKKVLAFSGIGDPQKFFDTLAGFGCWIAHTKPFGDHHNYTAAEADALLTLADSEGLELVTTEKDHVRLSHREGPLAQLRARTHTLPVSLVFEVKTDASAIITKTVAAYEKRRINAA